MLEQLKFVQGAVAKKDFNPAMTHFSIKDGWIKGTNGSLTLCAPIPLDLDAKPKAAPFVKAIQGCKGKTVQISVTPTGKLSVKAGKFRSLVECTDQEFPNIEPDGQWVPLTVPILPPLKTLIDFTSEDASKQWSLGVLFKGNKAFATNNIIVVEYELADSFPIEVNIPKTAVHELLRVGKEPVGVMLTETSITFMYDKNHWVRTQLYDLGWPDLSKVLDRDADYQEFPEGIFEAVESVVPFVDEFSRVYFIGNKITTVNHDAAAGATFEIEKELNYAVFNAKYFLKLKGIAQTIDLSTYPRPCLFKGKNIRGAIIGMRESHEVS